MSNLLVRKTLVVASTPTTAFRVFTEGIGRWWPMGTHHIGAATAADVVIEPRAGGRWFERGVDGSECNWGRVLTWEPPHRVELAWEISAEWKWDTTIQTVVEVRFTAVEGGTRVELEHRNLEAYGAAGEAMRGVFDSEGGWTGMLALYADAELHAGG